MSSIRVPDTIQKLDDKDAYPVVEGKDVGGFAAVEAESADNKKRIEVAEGHLQTLQSSDQAMSEDIRQLQGQVFNGIKIEDEDGNSFNDIKALAISGATATDSGGTDEVNLNISPKITVADGQTPGSTSVTGNAIIMEDSTVTVDPNDSNVIHVAVHAQSHNGINVSDGVNASREVQQITFPGHQAYGSDTNASIHIECLHFASKTDLDAWAAKFGAVITYDSIAVVDDDGNGFVGWYKFNAATKKIEEYDAQGVVIGDSNGFVPKNIKTIVLGTGLTAQQAGDQEDAVLINASGSAGIDGITVNGNKITSFDTAPPIQMDTGIGTGGTPRMLVDPRAYEEQHAASCLLQLDSDVTLQTGHATKLYTSHEIIPTGEYFSLNQQAGGVNVQDNTDGDTAVTGGELTRIMGSVSFYGKASANSNVKIWIWYKDPSSPLAGGILNDVNGNPMVVERYYNQGDDLSVPLVLAGAMMATGNAPIVMYVEVSAGDYVVNPDQTLICVEQFSDGYETSLASIEFQRRLAIESHAEIKSFKTTELSISDELRQPKAEQVVQANQGYDYLNEFGVQNLTELKASVADNSLTIKDNGNITDFYVDVYLDNIKTKMLHGKTIDYDVTIKNPHDAYRLEVYKWTGKPDQAGRIYDSRNNDTLNLNTGFELVKSKFIAEQPDGAATGVTDTATIPDDAKNIFIIIRPVEAQSPITFTLQEFKWGVSQPFRGYLETSRVNLREQHLWFSDSWAEFALTSNDVGFAGIRYTINNTPSTGNPMPVGKLYKGKAPVAIDNTVNQVSGSADPQMDGAIKFLKDGEASISKSYNVWNEQGTENTVTFWDVLIDVDGNETKIPDSERTFTVPANTGAPGVVYTIPSYNVEVETGQRVGGRATSNKADGAYVQSQNISEFLVQTAIEFKELVASGSDTTDLINAPLSKSLIQDLRYHEFSGNSAQNIDITGLEIPADAMLRGVTVEKVTSTGFASEQAEHAYNESTQTLTVHVSGAAAGTVFLEFWSKQ